MKNIIVLISLVCFAGCASRDNVPVTKLNLNFRDHIYKIESPTDRHIGKMEVVRGDLKFKMEDYTSAINPKNISAAGNAQVDVINAFGTQLRQGFSDSIKAFAASQGFPGGISTIGQQVKTNSTQEPIISFP